MRFLFALPDMAGNSPPVLEVARRLRARGHSVRMLAATSLRNQVEQRGCTFVPFQHAQLGGIGEQPVLSGSSEFAWIRDHVIFGPALDLAHDVLDELDANPTDAVVVDTMIPGALIGAEAIGVPSAVLIHSIYMAPAPGLPAFGMGLFPPRTWLGRARDRLLTAPATRMFGKGLPALNSARITLGLEPVESVWDLAFGADRALVMTSRAFDFEAESLPENVRYVGPQLEPEAGGGWDSPWSDEDFRPLVLVGLSTSQQGQQDLLGRIVDALGGLDVRALVTSGPAIDPSRFDPADNVVVRSFVPHAQVVPEAALVVTHAGHGTVIRALAAGVPLVCIPMGRDQHDVAARVVWRGAGLRLSTRTEIPKLRRAIGSALTNDSFRDSTRRLAQAISKEASQDLAVHELESLASSS